MKPSNSKKFDSITAKKIINEYAEKLNYYIKENQNLFNQIEDMKITLKINKDLLFKYISSNVQQTEQISVLQDYKNENLRLTERNETLYNQKIELEKKFYKAQQDFEDHIQKNREIQEKLRDEIFVLINKNQEKENKILNFVKDLEKTSNNNTSQIIVAEPSKVNVDLNNELTLARELVAKVSKLLNSEKTKISNLENKLKNYSLIYTTQNEAINDFEKSKITMVNLSKSSSEYIESDDDELILNTEDLKSPGVKFPDKNNYSHSSIPLKIPGLNLLKGKENIIPKLDFKIIQSKYQSEIINKIPVDKNKNENINNINKDLNMNNDLKKQIEKYKNELISSKEIIKKLNLKLKKCKIDILEKDEKIIKFDEEIKELNIKISILINPKSTEDISNKRNIIELSNL